MCVLTVANPYGVDHSTRYGFALGPVLAGRDSKCLAYKLDLDYVRGHEGGVAYAFEKGFAGMILASWGSSEDSFLSNALTNKRPGSTVILPARALRTILNCLVDRRPVKRGWVGLKVSHIQSEGGKTLLKVIAVAKGSPAMKAGIRRGETIVGVKGKEIRSIDDLYEVALWVEYQGIGKQISFQVLSAEGKVRTVTVSIGERPAGVQSFR